LKKVSEVEDPGSIRFIERQWRRERNERIITSTDAAIERRSSSESFEYNNFIVGDRASRVLFSQFEPYVISANDGDVVSVYNWQDGVKIRSFRNGNPEQSRITSLQFINQDDIPLLAVGSGIFLKLIR
jgi:regulator-associated protein of mTOR